MRKSFLLLAAMLCGMLIYAQEIIVESSMYDHVQDLHEQSTAKSLSILQETQAHGDWIHQIPEPTMDAIFFKLDQEQLSKIESTDYELAEQNMPGLLEGLKLKLMKVELFSPDFKAFTDDGNLNQIEIERGTHFRGVVDGDERSLVSISVFSDRIYGSILSSEYGRWNFGTIVEAEVAYLYPESLQAEGPPCATEDDGYVYTMDEITPKLDGRDPGDPVDIYIEADYDVYLNKGSVSAASSYLTGLFNEVASLFSAESVTVQISEIVIQTDGTQYPGSSSSQFLSSFQSQRTSWNGDLAILVNLVNVGGVAAGFNGLCNSNRRSSMCYAGIYSSYASVPTYSWSVDVFAHELGHLFGSRHTHACVWNGNGTAIDGCYTTEGSCTRPSFRGPGTIMSYCHLSGNNGKDFSQAFGTQPGQVLRNSVAAASCLGGGGTPHCENGIQDADEEGIDCGGADCDPCPPSSCNIPSPTNTTRVSKKGATCNWSSVSGASSYNVEIRRQGTSSWSSFSTTETKIRFGGLAKNTNYEWRVQADCSDWSSICTFRTGGSRTQSCGGSQIMHPDFALYPNPASQEVILRFPQELEGSVGVKFLDELGRVVLDSKISGTNSFDVTDLPRGLYFVRLQVDDDIETHKLILR